MTKDSESALPVIGLDLGDRQCQLCVLDLDGEVVEEGRISTTEAALTRRFSGQPRTRVVIETGTNANWVHDLLVKAGHEVVVANARKLRAISANERKSDYLDARMLADLGHAKVGLLRPVQVRPQEGRRDLALLRARAALVENRTSLVNCVRGLAKSAGHRLPACSAATFHKQKLDPALHAALAPLMNILQSVSFEIRRYDRAIVRMCKASYPQTKVLQRVQGVGPLVSLCFVLTICDPLRFKDARDVGAYLGLVPRRNQSGERDPELRITKTGDRMLRRLLVLSAHYILGPFGPDTDLRRFGLKLAARGGKTAKKRAVVATARKLAVLLFALLRTGEVYQPLRNSELALAS